MTFWLQIYYNENVEIRLIKNKDLTKCAEMISRSIVSMKDFYPSKLIDDSIRHFDTEYLKNKKEQSHFYVAVMKDEIVGCGGVDLMKGNEKCGVLIGVFVKPCFQRKGIGKAILNVLENDSLITGCSKIFAPSAISAVPFYKKCGYEHKGGILCFDKNKFWLEKEIRNEQK